MQLADAWRAPMPCMHPSSYLSSKGEGFSRNAFSQRFCISGTEHAYELYQHVHTDLPSQLVQLQWPASGHGKSLKLKEVQHPC